MSNQLLSDDRPITLPKLFESGENLSAAKLNEQVRAFHQITTGVRPGQQILPRAAVGASVLVHQRFQVVSVEQDYLVCNAANEDGTTGAPAKVAKPWTLRALESRDSFTFTSYTSDGQEKTAATGLTTEVALVVPQYRVDDFIVAANGVVGGTGASYLDGDGNAIPIDWIDCNYDSRGWTRKN